MFMPKQKLHTHEDVFKDHVSGQYDETIFRFRVPGGWIYTHTIIRFGSVDKNYVVLSFLTLKWIWIFQFIPRVIRDAIYDLVARNRYRWFGRRDACIPPNSDRSWPS
jgi:hypothetical protein